MRKILIVACVLLASSFHAFGQVPEPEFIGEVIVARSDTQLQYRTLPKERAQIRTAASASMYLIGVGNVKSKLTVEGLASPIQLSDKYEYNFIVKAENNNYDPVSIIRIFKFQQEEGVSPKRTSVLVKNSTFGSLDTNTREYISFSAKRYGESSYILSVRLTEGEYGITVDDIDDANSVVATFGVYDHIKVENIERERQMREDAIAEREALKAERKAKRNAKLYE